MQFTIIGVGKKEVKQNKNKSRVEQKREWIVTHEDNFAPSKIQKP